MIIDIRENDSEEIEGIKFDDSGDYIYRDGNVVEIFSGIRSEFITLCNFEDIDNLIKALQKAKELWGEYYD